MFDKWDKIWKVVVEVYPRYYPGICLGVLSTSGGMAVRIADSSAEFRTEHLTDTDLESCGSVRSPSEADVGSAAMPHAT
jgi:hypothetical protein